MIFNLTGRPMLHLAVVAASFAAVPGLSMAQSAGLDQIAAPDNGDGVAIKTHVLAMKERATVIDGSTASRIFGGRAAKPDAWPFQVSLHSAEKLDGTQRGKFGSQFCGGSLIAQQWVLTAAHCVVRENGGTSAPDSIIVRTSSIQLDEGDYRDVARVIAHKGYDPITIDNDIALLQLAKPITDASGPVGAVRVLSDAAPAPQGASIVIGWGMMEENKYPANLMETDIDIVPNETCNAGMREQTRRELGGYLLSLGATNRVPRDKLEEAFAILTASLGNQLSENMVCAGIASGARTSCSGDSGGPLLAQQQDGNWVQVGIVSWGREPLGAENRCNHKDLFSVYTKVSNYFDWIAQHLRG